MRRRETDTVIETLESVRKSRNAYKAVAKRNANKVEALYDALNRAADNLIETLERTDELEKEVQRLQTAAASSSRKTRETSSTHFIVENDGRVSPPSSKPTSRKR